LLHLQPFFFGLMCIDIVWHMILGFMNLLVPNSILCGYMVE
jgi:hypothetical protein